MIKVAINGLGRIGRATLKILLQNPEFKIVAINDLTSLNDLVYLLSYDTVYGRSEQKIRAGDGVLQIDELSIAVFSEQDPSNLPWGKLGVETVFECTGVFLTSDDLHKHIAAGAQRVILSAPAKDDLTQTVVHGSSSSDREQIYSCASCTTNCITPVCEIMERRIGVSKAIMTTVHAYTTSQNIVDGPHKSLRRGRAGAANLVPTNTGAAQATTRVLPEYAGRFDGTAIRAPIPCGSIADITFVTEREVSVDEINQIFIEEAGADRYAGILGVTRDPLVSADILQDPRAAVVDLEMTKVVAGDLVKVMAWYDNEWAYAAQMVRDASQSARQEKPA
ncbi:MAG TPA: glyceraldehyde 3-phosphate dehydrogenase NAD-binding domain-containing protein [Pelovirga sp.]|nr:glyceraldehyde 3-phosphate dehydrogenase NAD-binding domain-containing protein [Pelovirga sp.]